MAWHGAHGCLLEEKHFLFSTYSLVHICSSHALGSTPNFLFQTASQYREKAAPVVDKTCWLIAAASENMTALSQIPNS